METHADKGNRRTCSITTSIESLSSMSSLAGVSSALILCPSYRNLTCSGGSVPSNA